MTPICTPQGSRRPLTVALLLSALLLSGCGMFDWIAGETDPHPPVELGKLTPTLGLTTLWQTQVSKGNKGRQLKLVPALHAGKVFVADVEGRLQALDARSGTLIWKQETKHHFNSGPGVGDGLLVLGTRQGEVVAYDSNDGTERWRTPLASEILAVPRIASGIVVAPAIDGSVYGLNAGDGARRWEYRRPMPVLTLRGMSSPVITGNTVVLGFADGKLVSLELDSGTPLWELIITPPVGRTELDRMVDIDADPLMSGTTLYVVAFQGDLAAINVSDGAVIWRRPLSSSAGLTAAAQALYVTDAKSHVIAVDSQNGDTLWKQPQFSYRRLTAPALVDEVLLVGDFEGYLHGLAVGDGAVRARTRITKASISQPPQVADGVAYVYADDGTLAALRVGTTTLQAEAPATPSPITGTGSGGDSGRTP